MNTDWPDGVVYSETVIHSAPTRFAEQAPYQIALIDIPGVGRRTVRIVGARIRIGDRVTFDSHRDGVIEFRLCSDL